MNQKARETNKIIVSNKLNSCQLPSNACEIKNSPKDNEKLRTPQLLSDKLQITMEIFVIFSAFACSLLLLFGHTSACSFD